MKSLPVFLTFLSSFLSSGAPDITGKVYDALNHEQLIGASITVGGSSLAAVTALDGGFRLKGLSPGCYRLHISYLGYTSTDTLIHLSGQGKELRLDIFLFPATTSLKGVTISGMAGATDPFARHAEQASPEITNIVSAKTIQLSPDLTIGSVLRRVPGVSTESGNNGEGDFAIIRGMDQRYNYTLVNGIKIPSPDNTNRYVPMDLFPADLVERLEIIKTLSPDMEGDASGGAMNLVMKSAASGTIFEVSAAGGYNQMLFSQGYQGFDAGGISKASPEELHGPYYFAQPGDLSRRSLEYTPRSFTPDGLFNLTYGRRLLRERLGVIFAGSYQNYFSGTSGVFFVPSTLPNPAPGPNQNSSPLFTDVLVRNYSTQTTRAAATLHLDYQIDSRNQISLSGLLVSVKEQQYRHTVDTSLSGRNGPGQGVVEIWDRSRLELQSIANLTLQGHHQLGKRLQADWSAVYSLARRQVPGLAELQTTHTVSLDSAGNSIATPPLLLPLNLEWEHNTDQDLAGYLNVHFSVAIAKTEIRFSAGGLYRHKQRNNYDNVYTLTPLTNPDGSPQEFTSVANAKFGFLPEGDALGSASYNPGVYEFDENITAGYLQAAFTLLKKLEVLGGMRSELTWQHFATSAPVDFPGKYGTITYEDMLPSLNLKYLIDTKQDLRLAYFKSIARPGYADLIPFADATENEDFIVTGNPYLRHTRINNLDARYELFPSGLDEFMAGVFYKNIADPIEYALVQTNVNGQELQPGNFGTAVNFGAELVYIHYFGDFGVSANYTYTHSSITSQKGLYYRDSATGQLTTVMVPQTRPLQGQSASIGNLSLLYRNISSGWEGQLALVYTGARIAQLSLYRGLDEWQKGTARLDASAQKSFAKRWTVFTKLNHLLNTPYILEIRQPNPFRTGEEKLPYQVSSTSILEQREDYEPAYLLGCRYHF